MPELNQDRSGKPAHHAARPWLLQPGLFGVRRHAHWWVWGRQSCTPKMSDRPTAASLLERKSYAVWRRELGQSATRSARLRGVENRQCSRLARFANSLQVDWA